MGLFRASKSLVTGTGKILRLSVARFRAAAPRIRFYAREDPRNCVARASR